jgi:hypothetical protein
MDTRVNSQITSVLNLSSDSQETIMMGDLPSDSQETIIMEDLSEDAQEVVIDHSEDSQDLTATQMKEINDMPNGQKHLLWTSDSSQEELSPPYIPYPSWVPDSIRIRFSPPQEHSYGKYQPRFSAIGESELINLRLKLSIANQKVNKLQLRMAKAEESILRLNKLFGTLKRELPFTADDDIFDLM